MNYSKRDLRDLETIEQSWSGDELKIEEEGLKVWLTHPENRAYDGDYTIETFNESTGRWEQDVRLFD